MTTAETGPTGGATTGPTGGPTTGPTTGPPRGSVAPPGPVRRWYLGARPRTLPAALVPVVVATTAARPLHQIGTAAVRTGGAAGAASSGLPSGFWLRAAGALVVALAVQIATNYANDYSDGIRGTDDARVGPVRLVASGLASPGAVKRAAIAAFGVAAVVGFGLAWATSWWVLLVGAACLAAGWFYTGGPRPYGYAGLGEVFVFVFFGLVATMGTYYVETERLDLGVVWFAAVEVGLLATALLVANNLRDIATDSVTGKHTLAVRLGRRRAGWLYVLCVGLPFVGIVSWAVLSMAGAVHSAWPGVALVPLGAVPLALPPARLALGPGEGRSLLPVLAGTGRLQLAFGASFALALWLWVPAR